MEVGGTRWSGLRKWGGCLRAGLEAGCVRKADRGRSLASGNRKQQWPSQDLPRSYQKRLTSKLWLPWGQEVGRIRKAGRRQPVYPLTFPAPGPGFLRGSVTLTALLA